MKRNVRSLLSVSFYYSASCSVKDLRRDLRKWLSPPDPSTNHNIARKVHHEGTAIWFFDGGIFQEWKSSPSLLWIHGKRTSLSYPRRHPVLTSF
jgi:hypothetical protein